MPKLHVLKVFVGAAGGGGNPLGVFLDGHEVPAQDRQSVAADLVSETVFVDDAELGEVRIFTPGTELPFAGHPLVGTAWLLKESVTRYGRFGHRRAESAFGREDLTFITGRPEWAPGFDHIQLGSPAEVDALPGPPDGHDLAGVWAWIDEEAGDVRARVFAPRLGVQEDEATGAYAVRLAALLEQKIALHQGEGSIIFAEPRADGSVEIGGRTELVETRDYRREE